MITRKRGVMLNRGKLGTSDPCGQLLFLLLFLLNLTELSSRNRYLNDDQHHLSGRDWYTATVDVFSYIQSL